MIFNTSGGGTGGFNFKIVGGTTQPSSASENTIWVNTDVKITGWCFSATEPESPKEGQIWISVGTFSTVEFNALKKNGIQVYPISVKQYVSDIWMNKTAKTYQTGVWKDWCVSLIQDGAEMVDFELCTGIGTNSIVIEKTQEAGNIVYALSSSNSGYGAYGMYYKDVDLTNIKTIEIKASVSFTVANGTCKLAVLSKLPSDTSSTSFDGVTVASVGVTSEDLTKVSLDVSSLSLTGVHPVGLYFVIQFPATLTVSDFRCT